MNIQRIFDYNKNLIELLFQKSGDEIEVSNKNFFRYESNILLVAYDGNDVSGFLYAYILESLNSKQPKGFLYSIDVFEEYRRMKYGTALLNYLKDICRKLNCSEIFVLTNTNNLNAMKFYQTNGGIRENKDDAMFVFKITNF